MTTDISAMGMARFPSGFVNGYSMMSGVDALSSVAALSSAVASSVASQRVTTAPYAAEATRFFPSTVTERMPQTSQGFQDASVNTSELAQGVTKSRRLTPRPWQLLHMPYGLLNENKRGASGSHG